MGSRHQGLVFSFRKPSKQHIRTSHSFRPAYRLTEALSNSKGTCAKDLEESLFSSESSGESVSPVRAQSLSKLALAHSGFGSRYPEKSRSEGRSVAQPAALNRFGFRSCCDHEYTHGSIIPYRYVVFSYPLRFSPGRPRVTPYLPFKTLGRSRPTELVPVPSR